MIANVSDEKVQLFFRHLCSAYKKIEDSELARQDIKEHIQGIKDLSGSHTKASDIHKALKELESKIEVALQKQGKVIKHVYEEESFTQDLLSKISGLERQIGKYLEDQKKRAQRIRELEIKVKKVAKHKSIRKVKKKKPRKKKS